jgi:hypothetical protein
MPAKTPFAGLEVLFGPGDPLSSDGYAFTAVNPVVIDALLRIGAVTHRHDGHAAMADPTDAPVLAVNPAGGNIPGGLELHICYTLLDIDGGETLPVPATSIVTPSGFATPTNEPSVAQIAVPSGHKGLLKGSYSFGVTVTDGEGGETQMSPMTTIYGQDAFHVSGLTALVNAASGSNPMAGWRLWVQANGGALYLIGTGTHATDAFTYDGNVIGDCTISPPAIDTTTTNNQLEVTVPNTQPAGAERFAIYVSINGAFNSPALLGGPYPAADLGTVKTFANLLVQPGAPPPVSRSYPGAAKIDPDTEMLAFPWKRPVATSADLPSGANEDGDVRIALDTKIPWVWNAAGPAWEILPIPDVEPVDSFKGTVATTAALPSAGNTDGDVYLVRDSYQLWVWENTAAVWVPLTEEAANHQVAAYQLVLTDVGKTVEFDVAAGAAVTVPTHATVAFPVGAVIRVLQFGAGQAAITAAGGVTIHSKGGLTHTAAQYSEVKLRQRAVDEWVLTGDLA